MRVILDIAHMHLDKQMLGGNPDVALSLAGPSRRTPFLELKNLAQPQNYDVIGPKVNSLSMTMKPKGTKSTKAILALDVPGT